MTVRIPLGTGVGVGSGVGGDVGSRVGGSAGSLWTASGFGVTTATGLFVACRAGNPPAAPYATSARTRKATPRTGAAMSTRRRTRPSSSAALCCTGGGGTGGSACRSLTVGSKVPSASLERSSGGASPESLGAGPGLLARSVVCSERANLVARSSSEMLPSSSPSSPGAASPRSPASAVASGSAAPWPSRPGRRAWIDPPGSTDRAS